MYMCVGCFCIFTIARSLSSSLLLHYMRFLYLFSFFILPFLPISSILCVWLFNFSQCSQLFVHFKHYRIKILRMNWKTLFFGFWFSIVCWAACMAIAPQCFTNNVKTNGIKHSSQDQGTSIVLNNSSSIELTRTFRCHPLSGKNWPIACLKNELLVDSKCCRAINKRSS